MMYSVLTFTLCIGFALSVSTYRERRATCVEPDVPNICKVGVAGNLYYPHPTDTSKFLQCSANGKMYIVTCPAGEMYDQTRMLCDSQMGSATTMAPAVVNPVVNPTNPCTADNIAKGMLFFEVPSDQTKFIECINGNPILLTCPSRLIYSATRQSCILASSTAGNGGSPSVTLPSTGTNTGGTGTGGFTNPCKKQEDLTAHIETFFPGPSPNQYIQCDYGGNPYIKPCPDNLVWNQSKIQCDSPYAPGTGTVG